MMKYVIDSSAFMNLSEVDLEGELYTTPEIVSEIKDFRTKSLFESANIMVTEPKKESIARVREKAENTGDSGVLSEADLTIIALAIDVRGVVVTDDYDIQNICLGMGIDFLPVKNTRISKRFVRRMYCDNCMEQREKDVCPVCGAKTRAKVVKIEDIDYTD
jgi:UPF0271 protein